MDGIVCCLFKCLSVAVARRDKGEAGLGEKGGWGGRWGVGLLDRHDMVSAVKY